MQKALKIHPADSVAVALQPLKAGELVALGVQTVSLTQDIPAGHKLALRAIAKDERVLKYGQPIGIATVAIPAGAHVHTHNLHTLLSGELAYEYHPSEPMLSSMESRFFNGYARADGRAGIRNELWILPTVGCVNDIAAALERRAHSLLGGAVDNVCAFQHPYGCSQMGEDQENTRQILADLATHPNAGGVLVLGLGCGK
jgi:altronate hydrolase